MVIQYDDPKAPASSTPWQLRLANEAGLDPLFRVGACYEDPRMWAVRDAEDAEVCRCVSEVLARIVADALNEVAR
jgi:hypothetical protein